MTALTHARRLVSEARLDLLGVRGRVEVLADATAWRSRATTGYRAGVAALTEDLVRLIGLLEVSDEDLASAQHAEQSRWRETGGGRW